MPKVTLKAIAEKCGVSKGLVSLALSGGYGVSAAKRSDIVIAAIQMGYDFTRIKKRQGGDPGRLLYVLVKDIDLHTDRFWPEIIKGIESEAVSVRCRIKVKSWTTMEDFDRFIPELVETECVGILIVSEIPPVFFSNLVLSRIPMVLIDGKMMYDDQIDAVAVNNYAAFYQATRLLIENGHRDFVFVGSTRYAYSFNQRYLGYLDALRFHPEVTHQDVLGDTGTDQAPDLFNAPGLKESMRDGIGKTYLCANDVIAEAAYREACIFGWRIPEDVGVFGCDDIPSSSRMNPPLSTMAVPKKELGVRAVQTLFDRVTDVRAPYVRTNLMAGLVLRDSVRLPRLRLGK